MERLPPDLLKQLENNQGGKNYLQLILSGFAMGAADVVPGVSGGTIAFLLGIYEDLINAIHALNTGFFRLLIQRQFSQAYRTPSWRFLAAVGTGILLAILTVSRLLTWGLERFPGLIWAFFFGLVLASVFVIRKRVQYWTPAAYFLAILGAIFAFTLIRMTPIETPTTPWFLFLSGAIAISAMILPGISGAFLLLILGKYQFLLQALVSGNWFPLMIVASGAAAGLFSFARILRWLFRQYHDLTVAALVGLMIGALPKVWPWKVTPSDGPAPGESNPPPLEVNVFPAEFTLEVGLAFGLMLFGFGVVVLLDEFSKSRRLNHN